MTTRRFVLLGGASLLTATSAFAKGAKPHLAPRPPLARTAPVSDIYWGQTVVDPYRWMETLPHTPEWTKWLKGQADYSRYTLDHLANHKKVKAMVEHYAAELDVVFPLQLTEKYLLLRARKAGQQAYSLYVQSRQTGERKLLINPGAKGSKGQTPSIPWAEMSPDGKWLAYGIDAGTNEIDAFHVLNIDTLEDVTVTQISSRGSSWLPDSSGYFYFRLRADAVPGTADYWKGGSCWLHRIGSDPKTDVEVLKSAEGPGADQLPDDQPLIRAFPGSDYVLGFHLVNGDWPYLIYVARLSELSVGKTPWKLVCTHDDLAVSAVLVGDDIYVQANGKASRGEVFKVPAAAPDIANRVTVVAQSDYVCDSMTVAKDGLYFHELRGLVGAMKAYSFATGETKDTPLPAEGAVWGMMASPSLNGCLFGMDGLTWPARFFNVDATRPANGQLIELQIQPPLPFDVTRFTSIGVDVKVRDGAEVPISILHRKDVKLDGKNPVLIVAYGAYGHMLDPGFQAPILAFLDLGGVLVYACVRGGGEKGEDWHVAGKKATKPNTWRDAIDTAEYMIKAGWTAPQHLSIWGTSAGGIMVGRAITERPDLFRAAIGEVGAFNPLRMELTANGPGNDQEFGTFKKEDEFHALLEMDAYHHVRDGVKYPALLCMTGANDPRVEPWIVAKMAARMQVATASKLPVLLRVDYGSGHFSSSTKNAIEKYADMFSFVLSYTG